ncbi:MAG: hemerythrin domain-containing protein [Egibacteraceae bacterium]
MDAIAVLVEDHRAVNRAFLQYEDLPVDACADRREAVKEIQRRLTGHYIAERRFLHPVIAEAMPEGEEIVAEELRHQHELEGLLHDLSADGDTVHQLIRLVRARMEIEERGLFPLLRHLLEPAELDLLGERIATARA